MGILRRTAAAGAAVCLALVLAACGSAKEKDAVPAVRVGSKDFTENEIVAELYALALEDAALDEALPPQAVSTNARDIVIASTAIFPIVFMLVPSLHQLSLASLTSCVDGITTRRFFGFIWLIRRRKDDRSYPHHLYAVSA